MVRLTEFETLCQAFFTSPLKWICSALVPQRMKNEYKNRYMVTNDPYSIFQLEGQNSSYLVVVRSTEMSDCQTIRLTDLHNILCVDDHNESRNLFFGFSHRLCYNRSLKLTWDLKEHCGAKDYEDDLQSGYYYVNDETKREPPTVFRDCGSGLLGSPTLVLCLLLSLVIVLCLRWRAASRL